MYMWLDLQKPSLLGKFVVWETLFWNIESTEVLLCYILAMPDFLYKYSSLIASIS